MKTNHQPHPSIISVHGLTKLLGAGLTTAGSRPHHCWEQASPLLGAGLTTAKLCNLMGHPVRQLPQLLKTLAAVENVQDKAPDWNLVFCAHAHAHTHTVFLFQSGLGT
eukprot:TRINITY_DN86517_c0_g2_i3.p2 TRINITY_DN86517_c0_g2~~TRINITY_DN86517_c0_g2_i3.p2  ORF type:complete len:108 (+),score=17.95 TRINITY_DN86517_c0_g2_i3:199-522(+)